jgi:threonine/homoserine/homoserine lactone efflux protein
MFSAISEGILLGFFLAFSIGPAFFALLNTAISYGFKSGAALAFGIFFSDLFFVAITVLLVHFGMSDLLSSPKHQAFLGVVGGIVLIIYGVFHFVNIQGKKRDMEAIEIKSPKPYLLLIKGFFLNMFNPFVWIFWIATSTAISSKYEANIYRIIVFFLSVLCMVISTDLLKTFIAHKIKKMLTPIALVRVKYVSGAMLIVFGLYLIYNVFFLHR